MPQELQETILVGGKDKEGKAWGYSGLGRVMAVGWSWGDGGRSQQQKCKLYPISYFYQCCCEATLVENCINHKSHFHDMATSFWCRSKKTHR